MTLNTRRRGTEVILDDPPGLYRTSLMPALGSHGHLLLLGTSLPETHKYGGSTAGGYFGQ